jgi:hypothetical protein
MHQLFGCYPLQRGFAPRLSHHKEIIRPLKSLSMVSSARKIRIPIDTVHSGQDHPFWSKNFHHTPNLLPNVQEIFPPHPQNCRNTSLPSSRSDRRFDHARKSSQPISILIPRISPSSLLKFLKDRYRWMQSQTGFPMFGTHWLLNPKSIDIPRYASPSILV